LDDKNWLNWNGDLDNPTESEDDWKADKEYKLELENWFEDPQSPEQRDVSAILKVPGLIWTTWQ